MKDLPVLLQEEFFIGAVLKRESPFDCLLSKKFKLAELESGSLVGSSSLRRQSQILKLRPDLRVKN